MNAVEIEAEVSELFSQPFTGSEFPFAFLEAFGNKETTIKRLRKGDSNSSDVLGGVLQRNNIHLAVCDQGKVPDTLSALRKSPKTATSKVKFILATDGEWLEAEELVSGEVLATRYADLPSRFGFFLPLAGISTIKEIKDNPIDVRATGRLNKLYVELLKENPEWASEARRPDMNHFMARLIFCFFAEGTNIFHGDRLFTHTVEQMTESDGSNTAQVISKVFEAMNVSTAKRGSEKLPNWADQFPYVNGGLFSGSTDVPQFTRIARSYLLRAGELNWREINPDIFGSMIQAVADDEERGALGMHYTSVPNILKVLNPLFLDDLRAQLEAAGDNARMLLNLRKRMARIRVFDPACGSGNFLVIAYKEMRKIEAEVNVRQGKPYVKSEIALTNFHGIEIRDFAAEIARLALIIAEYQCDVLYRGEKLALAEFLPLNKMNWIVCGNALRLEWLTDSEPTGIGTNIRTTDHDLFATPLVQPKIDFENEGGETYICGNPPYAGYNRQSEIQKLDIRHVFEPLTANFGNLDYVSCWFVKASIYNRQCGSSAAFVATNSICQGSQVPILWPLIFDFGQEIFFARTSFKWSNLATNNAGITVIVVGIQNNSKRTANLYEESREGTVTERTVSTIGPYLVPESRTIVKPRPKPISTLPIMILGNHPYYATDLILSISEEVELVSSNPRTKALLRPYLGSSEIINGVRRACIWIENDQLEEANRIPEIRRRMDRVAAARLSKTNDVTAQKLVNSPHRFRDSVVARNNLIVIPQVSSERREYLPVGLLTADAVISFQAYGILDSEVWPIALIASRLHWVWIGTVCRRMRTDFSYSNTLGWNTFPVPPLTEGNKVELTRCAEDILLAREAHFPATIADLYAPENMPEDLRRAHERNDETLERIYIGRRFKNDTERLEKLFEMYTKMIEAQPNPKKAKAQR